jgi:hypothetical protein
MVNEGEGCAAKYDDKRLSGAKVELEGVTVEWRAGGLKRKGNG